MYSIIFAVLAMFMWHQIGQSISSGRIDFMTRTVSVNFTVSFLESPIYFTFWLMIHITIAVFFSYFPIQALREHQKGK
jgi:hypothetical protein